MERIEGCRVGATLVVAHRGCPYCHSDAHPCHSERSEESLVLGVRFFTTLRYVQNDMVVRYVQNDMVGRSRFQTCPYRSGVMAIGVATYNLGIASGSGAAW